MNYLQLCQRAQREGSISGVLSTVVSQSGEMRRLVDWVQSSYEEICALHDNWEFLRSSFTLTTAAADGIYLVSDVTDSRSSTLITAATFGQWFEETFRIYKSSDGVATQQWFYPRQYAFFRDMYLIGTVTSTRPAHFTIRPDDDALLLGPVPNSAYVITGDYQRVAAKLTLDADSPVFPDRFHMAIVWLALQKYAGYEEDAGLYDHAGREYGKILFNLSRTSLPPVELGETLA